MTTSPRPQLPPPGLRVGGYELLARLGEGGMGVVHLARRPGGERVALKVLRPHVVGDDEARSRLAREVASLSRIRSHRVAEIIDADPWGDIPYVATRYVPGLSLDDHVAEEGPLGGGDLDWFARCLAEALLVVHEVGVLHRDVKPSNVLMEGRTPVLIDFGLARVAEDPRLTQTGWLLGTPGYLAPEILYGEDATTASDVHSWAATTAFAGTGRGPFGRGPAMAIMDRVRRGEHDLSGLDEDVRDVVVAALDPDPRRRPTLHEVLDWLDGHPVALAGPGPVEDDVFTTPLRIVEARAAPTVRLGTRRLPDDDVRPDDAGRPDDQWPFDEQGYDEQGHDEDEDLDDGEEGADWLQPLPVQQRPPFVERLRRLVLLLGLAGGVAGAVALAPYVAVVTVLVLVWLLRTGSLAASAAGDRRRTRGSRWYDGPQTVLAAPFHLVGSIPGTVVLALWASGIGLAAALLCFAVALGTTASLGVVGAAFALGLWVGPGGGRVRRPLRRVVHPLSARPVVWLVAAAAVLAVASGLLTLAQQTGTSWAPAGDRPFAGVTLPSYLRP